MNAHDSERIRGLLEELGLGEASTPAEADVLVFNTCTIREKPDQRLAAYLGDARMLKVRNPDAVIAVGGCYAEAQRDRIFERYPFVDVAFGPGTIHHLGDWLGAGGLGVARSAFGTADERRFSAELATQRERPFQAWVQISMGCNSVCSYCIVPAVRGREVSRRPGEILAEIARLADDGVREITLLGQNVNSWGRDLLPDVRSEFGELLRAVDAVDGIERIRFTSPHPKDFRAPVIAAMAECDAVCEHAHLPLQSGSTRVLKRMRRTYSRERYLRLVDELRAAVPDLALTTDLIVGFPGETDGDFDDTCSLVEEVGFDGAFTFVYSPRSGTEAAAMPDQVPDELKRERIERLVEVVQRVAAERNARRVGLVEEVLVEGASRTDPSLLRGRTRRNTTVNFAGSADGGELVPVRITGLHIDDSSGQPGSARRRVGGPGKATDLGRLRQRPRSRRHADRGRRRDDVRRGRARRQHRHAHPPKGRRELLAYGVKRVIDLRWLNERDEDPQDGAGCGGTPPAALRRPQRAARRRTGDYWSGFRITPSAAASCTSSISMCTPSDSPVPFPPSRRLRTVASSFIALQASIEPG